MIENNSHAMQLFTRFESPSKIKEEYHIFNKFSPYSEKEAHFINKLALEVYEKTNALESFLDSGNWSKVRNQSLALSCLEELKENSVSPQHKTYSISKTALVNKVIIIVYLLSLRRGSPSPARRSSSSRTTSTTWPTGPSTSPCRSSSRPFPGTSSTT